VTVTYTDEWGEKGNKREHGTIPIFREEVTSALADFHAIGFSAGMGNQRKLFGTRRKLATTTN